jgi:hypothetical protein
MSVLFVIRSVLLLTLLCMQFIYFNYYYYYIAIACSPGSSRPYTDRYKQIRLYIKGTIQNKVHTVQIQTCTVTRSTHVTRTQRQQSQCIWVSSVIAVLLVSSVFTKSRKNTLCFILKLHYNSQNKILQPLSNHQTSSFSHCTLSEGQAGGAWGRSGGK